MSRNASGTYSLPAGNPVVTGTAISSATHNNTMSDVGTEITDSLSRSGKGPMLAPLEATDGSAAAPSITFDSDTDTGLYRIGANNLGVALNGVKAVDIGTAATAITGTLTTSGALTVTSGGATVTAGGLTVTAGGATVTAGGVVVSAGGTGGRGIDVTGTNAGQGIRATGGASDGEGVRGIGGATNGAGVVGAGTGTGAGVTGFSASGIGVEAIGNATRAPLRVTPQAAPSSLSNGDMWVDTGDNTLKIRINGVTKTVTVT